VWLGVFLWVGQVVAESEPQKIALLVPLTGALADWGVGMEKGARMALEESNSPVKLLVEDSQFDPKAALLALERLRTTNRLDALIVFGSSVSQQSQLLRTACSHFKKP